jgi:hypothetical protein
MVLGLTEHTMTRAPVVEGATGYSYRCDRVCRAPVRRLRLISVFSVSSGV